MSQDAFAPYCVPGRLTFGTVSGFDILGRDLSEEAGGDWVEAEGSLSGLLSLRSDIMQGDCRSLDLA